MHCHSGDGGRLSLCTVIAAMVEDSVCAVILVAVVTVIAAMVEDSVCALS